MGETKAMGLLGQMTFGWESASAPPCVPSRDSAPEPGAVAPSRTRARRKRGALSAHVGRFLRQSGVEFVDVGEARKGLFETARLCAFHFVVYPPSGRRWLVYAAKPGKQVRLDLAEWEKIFGDEFAAVVARSGPDSVVRFRRLDGEEVGLAGT